MSLRVTTLNAWLFGWNLSPYNVERRQHIIAHAVEQGIHVLALQEVWGSVEAQLIIEAGRKAGYGHFSRSTGGLLLLSQYPLLHTSELRYKSAGLPHTVHHGDYWAAKGAQVCVVATPHGPVRIVNTHLIARYTSHGREDGDEYVGHRAAQVVELLHALNSLSDDMPTLLCGDFNLQPEDTELQAFTELSGYKDIAGSAVSLSARPSSETPAADGHHQYATASVRHHPFSRDTDIGKKLDHMFMKQSINTDAHTMTVERVELDFFDCWTPLFPQSVAEKLLCGLLGRRSHNDTISYSDHVGITAVLRLDPPKPQLPSAMGVPPARPAAVTYQDSLRGQLVKGETAAHYRMQFHALVFTAAAVGVRRSWLPRQFRRWVLLPLCVLEGSLAVHSLQDVHDLRSWKQRVPSCARAVTLSPSSTR